MTDTTADGGNTGGGYYSLKAVLTQSPETVKVTIMTVLGVVLALFSSIDPSLLETVGAGLAIERVLSLFYVAPIRKAQEETHALVAFENVKLKEQANK